MKKPRLFYCNELVTKSFVPITEGNMHICVTDFSEGKEYTLRFQRVDLTDEEFNALYPEL